MSISNQLICLLVEDEPLILKLLTTQLEDGGFSVVTASDGAVALRMIADHHSDISAMVTDIRMPGVDGWELARRARDAMPEIPVVYVSGDSASQWDREGVPNSLMLQKPFLGPHLLTALATLLGVNHSNGSANSRGLA